MYGVVCVRARARARARVCSVRRTQPGNEQ